MAYYDPDVVYLWDAYDCVQTVGPTDPLVANAQFDVVVGYDTYTYRAHGTPSGQPFRQEYVWTLTLKAGKILTLGGGYSDPEFEVLVSAGDTEQVAVNGGSYTSKGPGLVHWDVDLVNSGSLTSIGVKVSGYRGPFSMFFPNAVLSNAPPSVTTRWEDYVGTTEVSAA